MNQITIYTVCNSAGFIWVSHTSRPLTGQMNRLRKIHARYLKSQIKRYDPVFKLFESANDASIKVVETFAPLSRFHVLERCQYWINHYYEQFGNAVVNNVIKKNTMLYFEQKYKQECFPQQVHRCLCGGLHTSRYKSHHMKTAKHRRFDSTLNYLKEHDPEFYNLIVKDHQTDQIFNDSCKY